MFVPLPQYASQSDKNSRYRQSLYIDNEQDLKKEIDNLLAHNDEFIYRGIYDASYKMYSSSQRLWFLDDNRMLRLGCTDYYDTIECLIKLAVNQPDVQQYIQQNNLPYNDFLILAMLQHFGSPSPMLDFSNNVLKGLFFAVDNMPTWTDKGTNNLDDYVSLYYIRKDIDWPDLAQKMAEESNMQYQKIRPEYSNTFFLRVGDYSFLNNTKDIPFVEVMNSVCKKQHFCCLNIRKHLVPLIQSCYLQPNGITYNSVYCIGNAVSDQLPISI